MFNLFSSSVNSQDAYSIRENLSDIFTDAEFKRTISGKSINHDVVIRNGVVKSLSPVEEIRGTLGLSDCQIKTLSPVRLITGEVWCSFHDRKPRLKTLGTLQRVNGNASFRYVPLEELGDLEYVGGDLSLRDTRIETLGKLTYVGGNLSLPMRLKDKIDLSSISIGGKVRYWNDAKAPYPENDFEEEGALVKSDIPVPYWPHTYIYPNHNMNDEPKSVRDYYRHFKAQLDKGVVLDTEGYSNYPFMLVFDLQRQIHNPDQLAAKYELLYKGYPKLKWYCLDILIDLYKNNKMMDKAWQIAKSAEYLSISTVNAYAGVLGDEILDGEIAAKICGTGCLTPFGKTHVNEVLSFFRQSLKSYEEEHGCRFFNVFYDNGKSYKAINGQYSAEYYRQFYKLDEASFEAYEAIGNDDYHRRNMDSILVVEHAVTEQLRVLLIDAEDLYRESIGVAKIGEGWINETALFYKIKNHFANHNVIQHGHPKWLGKQHLDIYFVDLNIGVEYQGVQHYKPVDYFGGEEGFAQSQERDERKRQLCKENSCPLIYVDEGYDFDNVIADIQKAIRNNRAKKKKGGNNS